jgi:hypothetical protein
MLFLGIVILVGVVCVASVAWAVLAVDLIEVVPSCPPGHTILPQTHYIVI